MEFLHTKDPLFYNKPLTRNVTFRVKGKDLKLNYRVLVSDKVPIKREFATKRLLPYDDNDTDMISCVELDDGIEIVPTKNGKFLNSFHIAERCYSHIIGVKGHKKREIENNTGTHIIVPKPGAVDQDVVILGRTERNVATARNQINMILLKLRERERPTHFISIPVISNEIKTNFLQFKNSVLHGFCSRGVEENIFQKPEKLHLTITTLVLWDENEVQDCIKIVSNKKDELWPLLFPTEEPLKILLQGLEIMNDDPKDVHVLYAKVHMDPPKYNGSFQRFVNGLSDALSKRAFTKQQYENIKLHVTLMNSTFRNADDENENAKRKSFDASFILEKYRNFKFGIADLKNMHVSIRFQYGDDKYYKPECIIDLTQ